MSDLAPSSWDSPIDENAKDASINVIDRFIAVILDNGVFEEIPIVRAGIGIIKTMRNLREYNSGKQLADFINELNDGSLSREKINTHKAWLKSRPKKAEREASKVLLLIDRTIDEEKSRLMGRFYRAYLDGSIGWPKFEELSEVTSRLLFTDIGPLPKIRARGIRNMSEVPFFKSCGSRL